MNYTNQCCVVLKQYLGWFCNPVLTFTVLRAHIVCLRASKNWPSSKLSYLGERIEPSELLRLLSRASRASTFHHILQMESLHARRLSENYNARNLSTMVN